MNCIILIINNPTVIINNPTVLTKKMFPSCEVGSRKAQYKRLADNILENIEEIIEFINKVGETLEKADNPVFPALLYGMVYLAICHHR